MSIRLIEAAQIAGVHTPANTIPTGLTVAMEADLVTQNKAVWVNKPAEASECLVPVFSRTNLTGVIKNSNPDGSKYNTPKQSDSQIDYIAYGLTLPTSGTIGVASIAAGVAYVSGFRIPHAGSVLALEGTKDNYIDIDYDGNIVVSAVAVAAPAPAKASNSLRLGYCTTNTTSVTGATTTGKDSNGNWLRNTVFVPHCRLLYSGSFGVAAGDTAFVFGSGTTQYDNDSLHSESVNTSRITIQHSGLYDISGVAILTALGSAQNWGVKIFKNGSSAGVGTITAQADKTLSLKCGGHVVCEQGDYIQLVVNVATTPMACAAGTLSVTKVG